MKTVMTDAGIAACIQAGLSGPLVKVSGVKIGSTIISPDSSMTTIPNIVWEGDSSYVQYQIVDDRTFLFKVTLDESIGDFDIGCLELDLDDGTAFTISTLIGIEKKIANNDPIVGNRKVFEIPIVLAGISNVLDVTLLVPDEGSIPFVQTEESLPEVATAPFSVYSVVYHTELKTAALAVRTTTGWQFCVADSGEGGKSFDPGLFDENVEFGSLVYFDATSGLFKLADGTDSTKGFDGIKGSSNNIINSGIFRNPSWSLTPGMKYYASASGALTTTINNFYVGKAVDAHSILLIQHPETANNKVNTISLGNPSLIRYPSEKAVADIISEIQDDIGHNYALKDMSNVGAVTFKDTITFEKTIHGKTSADSADLAEYYLSDRHYPEGTLVRFGGDEEITIALEDKVNAVVTTDPAYLMNNSISSNPKALPVALIGRVPVRVTGKLNKFDQITLSEIDGVACKSINSYDKIIGIALEDKDYYEEGNILCSILLRF